MRRPGLRAVGGSSNDSYDDGDGDGDHDITNNDVNAIAPVGVEATSQAFCGCFRPSSCLRPATDAVPSGMTLADAGIGDGGPPRRTLWSGGVADFDGLVCFRRTSQPWAGRVAISGAEAEVELVPRPLLRYEPFIKFAMST